MADEFQAQLSSIIHGKYDVDGTSYIYRHEDQTSRRRQGVELHEWVHSELIDNTAFGQFQRQLKFVEQHAPAGAFRDKCGELFSYSMDVCKVTHEGLAAYRELCWLASNESNGSARAYLDSVPPEYREGIEKVMRLLGDPFVAPYQGIDPPGFHTLLITLGLALMNTPILAEYSDPERVFELPLTWLLTDGPDQRLQDFADRADDMAATLMYIAIHCRELIDRFLSTKDGVHLREYWNVGVETLRLWHPDLPMLTKGEAEEQFVPMEKNWVAYLNRLAERSAFVPGTYNPDVSGERSLNMRLYPADPAQSEARPAADAAIRIDIDDLVEAVGALQSSNVAHLAKLSTIDQQPPFEGFLDLDAGILANPMWTASASGESPWASFERSIFTFGKVRDFVSVSTELDKLSWCWYTNPGIVSYLRKLGQLPKGFVFERCGNPKDVLLGLDRSRQNGGEPRGYWIGDFPDEETLVAIVHDNLFSFSFGTILATEHFEKAVVEYGLTRLEQMAVNIGTREYPLELIARWARWGAFGM